MGWELIRALLDTHTMLWWFTDDERLPVASRDVIGDSSNEVYVSAVSAWEIATKHRLGKLPEAMQAAERFGELVAADGFTHLPVSYLHCLRAGGYARAHRDPFDRMLAAQGELEMLTLVTKDPAFAQFDVTIFW